MRRLVLALALVAGCGDGGVTLLSFTPPEDTRDTQGPYVVQAEVRGRLGDDHLVLCWRAGGEAGGRFLPVEAEADDQRGDLHRAAIPGQPPGTTIEWLLGIRAGVDCPAAAEVDELRSFRVLRGALACTVDSDCLAGREICVGGTCRAFDGACADGACPGGTACDEGRDVCVIPARPCSDDTTCPVAERCDVERGECTARPACSQALPCPVGLECKPGGFCAAT
jgi:hypothetical protein